mmetsp:Transcript_21520/g.50123  ORF Transcript_21520/g.50123 Transcript_21520/m.50123 type:complete len:411 (-) Transcript_21520:36-1268(-)|eukprot:CAMPEP_0171059604 /NCGR_PEP_ID=MMETSP0766_2-20121228/3277_1 /TAXON_ID=439317 /ORGANISM="Gambierdiscus australes, Strain CAWD 149" /LENGTH=410 /DNA_ID=CAMNT_0011515061 /DNA_START=54 /DNA_END=1286 /DNA_ORIENTATION=-
MPRRRRHRAQGGHVCTSGGSKPPEADDGSGVGASFLSAQASVILLHGLGDSSAYWQPFHSCLMHVCEASGVRWLALDAPKRVVWGELMPAWFEYVTCRDGEDVEDEIVEEHLLETRASLHSLVDEEAVRLKEVGGRSRVLLIGSSQGGSAALDAALSLPGATPLAGVALLRSLPLGVSRASAEAARLPLPVLAVSGQADQTFSLSLVQRQWQALGPVVELSHSILEGLDHDTEYDAREVALTLRFLAQRLGLELSSNALSEVALGALLPHVPAAQRPWALLSDGELQLAAQLGIRSQRKWDDGTAAVWSKAWRDLTYLQRSAAKSLGYSEESWDEEDGGKGPPSLAKERSWAELSEEERQLARRLGVNSAGGWDNGTAPVWARCWAKLSAAQRQVAVRLGWGPRSWEEDS